MCGLRSNILLQTEEPDQHLHLSSAENQAPFGAAANTSSFTNPLSLPSFNWSLCWPRHFATLLRVCDQKGKSIPCLMLTVGTVGITLERLVTACTVPASVSSKASMIL